VAVRWRDRVPQSRQPIQTRTCWRPCSNNKRFESS
jgi:hypothetical protein